MAKLSLQAESVCANPLEALNQLACSVQHFMSRTTALVEAIGHASEEIDLASHSASLAALDRMLVYADMIEEAAIAARDQAEEIEKIGLGLRYPRAA